MPPWKWSPSDVSPAQDFKDVRKELQMQGFLSSHALSYDHPQPMITPIPFCDWEAQVITGEYIKKPLEYGFIYLP